MDRPRRRSRQRAEQAERKPAGYPGRQRGKRPRGPRRPRQVLIGKMLRCLGFRCEFIDTLDAVDDFVDRFLLGCERSPYSITEEP